MGAKVEKTVTTELQTVYVCDVCGEGYMLYNGPIGLTGGSAAKHKYRHRCTDCGNTVEFDCLYPHSKIERQEC